MSISDWWRSDDKKPKPDDNDTTVSIPKYVQAWNLLRKIPVEKLGPAVLSVSTVIFFAISGVLAWLVLFGAFVCQLFKKALKWFKIVS